jgi:glycosyltransferase involved in cell wall biosynthesis
MKILSIVPAYNEETNILNVLQSLNKEYPKADIVVVNDCSNDNTEKLVQQYGKSFLINLPCHLGIGGAVQTGFKFAVKNDYDIAFQFDGDGQHKASEINKLIEPLLKDETDVVIGSRFLEKHKGFKSTKTRQIGIKFFEIVIRLLTGQKITDATSGFRAYNRKAISFLSQTYPTDYPEPEAILLLNKNGFRIKEVFITMQERKGGKSNIKGIISLYYMLKVLLSVSVTNLRPKIKGVSYET